MTLGLIQKIQALATQIIGIALLTCANPVFAADSSIAAVPPLSEDSHAVANEKGVALLELARFYELSDDDEKAAALYEEAARSQDALIRHKAVLSLARLDKKHWVPGRFRSLGSASTDVDLTVYKGAYLAIVTAILILLLWLLVRCARMLVDWTNFMALTGNKPPRIDIQEILVGSDASSALKFGDVFQLMVAEMRRQQTLASLIAPRVTIEPVMRAESALGDAIGAALDVGERGSKLITFFSTAWIRPATFKVSGSATTVANRVHAVIFLAKSGEVVATWNRSFWAWDILDNMKDLAYAALLECHARS